MRRLVMVVAIVALLASTAVVLWSQGPGGTGGGGGGNRGGGMMGRMGGQSAMSALTPPFGIMNTGGTNNPLNLTDDQKAKLKTATDDYTKATTAAQTKIDAARKALRDALMNPSSSDADIQKLIAAAQEADKPVAAAQVALWKVVAATLTADQLKTLSQPMGGMGGRGFGGGGGGRRGGGDNTPPPPGPAPGT